MRWLASALAIGAAAALLVAAAMASAFNSMVRPFRKTVEGMRESNKRLTKPPEWREEMQRKIDGKD